MCNNYYVNMYKSDKKVYKLDTKSTVTCHLKPVTCSLTQPLNIPSIWGVWGSSWQTCWWQSSMQCLAQSAYCPPLFCNRWASCSGRMWPIQSGVDARGRQDLLDPPGQGGLRGFVVELHNREEYSGSPEGVVLYVGDIQTSSWKHKWVCPGHTLSERS